ncbi:MAG: hypothetical protein KAY24_06535 [Candidatus Eisenbacteria sp.]|nr:hypothetical protein [Candidatus Eisenbacteria bacterium]
MEDRCHRKAHLGRTRLAWIQFAIALLALCWVAAPANAGVSVSIYPDPICAELEEVFTAFVWVDSAGSEFDGYETVIRFDPTVLTFVSAQQESLMIDPPGSTWWLTEVGDSTVFISHVLLSGGVVITGPGALSSITFQAPAETGDTDITFDYIEFYRAGQYVPDIVWHDGTVLIRENCSLAACCVMEACNIVLEEQCEALGGAWHPEWTSCDPNPCGYTEIREPHGMRGTLLYAPSPNPFTRTTALRFYLQSAGHLQVGIYDPIGRCVRQLFAGHRLAGLGVVEWDGSDHAGLPVAPGAYFCHLSIGTQEQTQRLTLLK